MGWGDVAGRSLRALALLGSGMTGGALLLSFLSPWSPLADSLAHFRLHLAALLSIGAGALWLLHPRRPALLAAALALYAGTLGLSPAFDPSALWGRTAARAGAGDAAELKLLQLNLLYRNTQPEAVLALIARERPDLIALQEVPARLRPLLDQLRRDYPHQQFCRFARVGGVAVLSRFSPVAKGDQGCAGERELAWLRAAAPGGPVTTVSLHLHWPWPYGQEAQIGALAPHLEALPRPLLIGGDFNAAPWSHAAARIARASGARVLGGLRFTFHFSATLLGRSRATPIGMPIDLTLADRAFAPRAIAVGPPVGSDHLPVITTLSRPNRRTGFD